MNSNFHGLTFPIPNLVSDDLQDDFAERDPSARYVRYNEILGRGAFKTVYKAFDEVNGIEVAWNQVDIDEVLQSPQLLERLYSEVHLLKSLKHVNIIKCYHSWVDDKSKTVNMITELFTSGNLRQYRKKHKNVDMKAIKNWARQILRGLQYLHGHNPCIIHRDLKCDNVFVNGNTGEVKIGDLGLATVMQQPTARSVIGTPEFMAPELYEEEYNELVDVYSFGMCLLEMVTCDYPYSECKNPAQIYKKVTSGVKPIAFGRVTDPQVKDFIEKCLLPASLRPSAEELLKDPFLASSCSSVLNPFPIMLTVPESPHLPKPDTHSMDIDLDGKNSSTSCMRTSCEAPHPSTLELVRFRDVNTFNLIGELEDDDSISMSLRIADIDGNAKNIHFVFYLQTDTTISIVREMVEEKCLAFSEEDVVLIAQLMEELIGKLVPHYRPSYDAGLVGAKCSLDEGSYHLHTVSNSSGCLRNSSLLNDLLGKDQGAFESFASGMSTECSLVDHSQHPHYSLGDHSKFSNSSPLDDLSLLSMSSLTLMEKDYYKELKQELDAIDSQYHQCFHELLKRREEAIEDAKKRWSNRKISVA